MTAKRPGPWWRWLALLLAMAMLAAACGGDDDADETADEVGTETEEAEEPTAEELTEQATGEADEGGVDTEGISTRNRDSFILAENDLRFTNQEPKVGGEMVWQWRSDVQSMDPRSSISFSLHYRLGPVYQRLYTLDIGPDIAHYEQVQVPELAADFPEISEDGLTYTIKLRDDVVWQNVAPVNGRPFVADDVVATLTAYKESLQSAFIERVESIEAVDDHTVQLNLSAPFAPLTNHLANHHMWILPAEAFDEASGYDFDTPAGTGPFILEKREFDVENVYVRNPDYWKTDANGTQLPYLDSFRLSVIKDQDQAIAAFKAGEIDVTDIDLAFEAQQQLMDEYPDGQYFAWLHGSTFQIFVNMNKPEFQDLNVRKAVSLAIDRQGMGDTIRDGGIYPGPVNANIADFVLPQEELAEYLRYDPEEATQLLADAGYADGFDVTITQTEQYGTAYVAQVEWVAADLEAIGLNVDIETLDYGTYIDRVTVQKDFELVAGPQTPFQEVDEWLRILYHTDGARNSTNWSDPALDALLEEQLSILDKDERKAKTDEIQRYILDNMAPPIPGWTHAQRKQMQPWVRNISPAGDPPMYGFIGLDEAWLDK